MGVDTKLVVYAETQSHAEDACRAAFDRVAQLEDVMSDYRPTSEVMRLCGRSGGPPVPISDDLYRVLSQAKRIAEESHGTFDPTVGSLVRLWRVSRKTGRLPPPDQLAAARALVGYQWIELTPPPHPTARLARKGMLLDFGGIAKGDAGDQAILTLRQHGIASALFQSGGDIVLGDPPPGAPGWIVDLPHPPTTTPVGLRLSSTLHPLSSSSSECALANCAISTTGDSNQFVEIAGTRYSHVVDPHTGLGLTTRRLVTVIARKGLTSDPLSKAASMLDDDQLREVLAHHPDVSVYRRTMALGE